MTRKISDVLDELEAEEFPDMPTKKQRTSATCRHCGQEVRLRAPGAGIEFAAHRGPCGLPCLSGGVSIGLPFHEENCSHPKCAPLRVPIPGIPRRRRR